MMTITKTAANRVDIDLSGALDTVEMTAALDKLIAVSAGVTHGRMLYRIGKFEMPTLGAIAAEFARMPQLLKLLAKFDRCAVISDAAWIRTASEIEGALIPSLAIKGFQPDQLAEAERWLNNTPTAKADADPENYPV